MSRLAGQAAGRGCASGRNPGRGEGKSSLQSWGHLPGASGAQALGPAGAPGVCGRPRRPAAFLAALGGAAHSQAWHGRRLRPSRRPWGQGGPGGDREGRGGAARPGHRGRAARGGARGAAQQGIAWAQGPHSSPPNTTHTHTHPISRVGTPVLGAVQKVGLESAVERWRRVASRRPFGPGKGRAERGFLEERRKFCPFLEVDEAGPGGRGGDGNGLRERVPEPKDFQASQRLQPRGATGLRLGFAPHGSPRHTGAEAALGDSPWCPARGSATSQPWAGSHRRLCPTPALSRRGPQRGLGHALCLQRTHQGPVPDVSRCWAAGVAPRHMGCLPVWQSSFHFLLCQSDPQCPPTSSPGPLGTVAQIVQCT